MSVGLNVFQLRGVINSCCGFFAKSVSHNNLYSLNKLAVINFCLLRAINFVVIARGNLLKVVAKLCKRCLIRVGVAILIINVINKLFNTIINPYSVLWIDENISRSAHGCVVVYAYHAQIAYFNKVCLSACVWNKHIGKFNVVCIARLYIGNKWIGCVLGGLPIQIKVNNSVSRGVFPFNHFNPICVFNNQINGCKIIYSKNCVRNHNLVGERLISVCGFSDYIKSYISVSNNNNFNAVVSKLNVIVAISARQPCNGLETNIICACISDCVAVHAVGN